MRQSEYFEVTIPALPPGINRTYINTKSGGKALTPEARDWDRGAALVVGSAAGEFDFEPDLTAEYMIVVRWWGGRHDTDAILKAVQDTVTRKLGFDDRRIKECVIQRRPEFASDDEPVGIKVHLIDCKLIERDWVSSLILEALGVMDMPVEMAKVLEPII